jgi:hypothetical protein
LTAFAERYFYLAEADSNGKTKRETLTAQLERARRKRAVRRVAEIKAELAMPPFPRAAAYIWQAYRRLRRRAAVGFSGPQPIAWSDIDAFLRRSGVWLRPWEIQIIESIDDVYLQPQPKPFFPEGEVVVAASAADVAGVRSVLTGVSKRRVVRRKGRATK